MERPPRPRAPRVTSRWLVLAVLALALVFRTSPPLLRAAPAAVAAHAAARALVGHGAPGEPRTEPCTHKAPPGARRGAAIDDDDDGYAAEAPPCAAPGSGSAPAAAPAVTAPVACDGAGHRPEHVDRLASASPRGPPARA